MQFKQLLNDDDAVSPVIGVILMVAITVILAAVIGTFVLGLGDQVQQTSPTAQFSFDYTASPGDGTPDLEISHDGGDGIEASQLSIVATNLASGTSGDSWTAFGGSVNSDSKVTAGNTATIEFSSDSSDNEASLVWNADSGDRSSTLAEWEN